MFTDGIAQSGLCDVFDGCLIFLNFQCRLLHIPNRPVDNGIHIDRDGIFGQRLFRFADILLIDAEAKLRNGNEGGALQSINRVRQRAGEPKLESLTLKQIWDERRFEFVFENDRYFDLVRTGEAKTVLAYKNWSYPKNVFYPVPQDQIDLSNGALKQNVHWE